MTQMCLGLGGHPLSMGVRPYGNRLTAELNRKGVLDVDTVKGCPAGMAARPDGGCYGCCYACRIARFRGIDFGRAVVRYVDGGTHADEIVGAVQSAPYGFFRVGVMGDPSHAWGHTVDVVEWLAPYAVPVVVTKHWTVATNRELGRMVACGTVLNTSVSALDTPAQLAHRREQIDRYGRLGGVSVARIVSCDFDRDHPMGASMAEVQDGLFGTHPHIDNPLRVPKSHALVREGVVRVRDVVDLASKRTLSLARQEAYVGHCGPCPDRCGLAFCGEGHPRPKPQQISLFERAA